MPPLQTVSAIIHPLQALSSLAHSLSNNPPLASSISKRTSLHHFQATRKAASKQGKYKKICMATSKPEVVLQLRRMKVSVSADEQLSIQDLKKRLLYRSLLEKAQLDQLDRYRSFVIAIDGQVQPDSHHFDPRMHVGNKESIKFYISDKFRVDILVRGQNTQRDTLLQLHVHEHMKVGELKQQIRKAANQYKDRMDLSSSKLCLDGIELVNDDDFLGDVGCVSDPDFMQVPGDGNPEVEVARAILFPKEKYRFTFGLSQNSMLIPSLV